MKIAMAVCALLGVIRNESDVDTYNVITCSKNKKGFLIGLFILEALAKQSKREAPSENN